jgi:hypothetical protein
MLCTFRESYNNIVEELVSGSWLLQVAFGSSPPSPPFFGGDQNWPFSKHAKRKNPSLQMKVNTTSSKCSTLP